MYVFKVTRTHPHTHAHPPTHTHAHTHTHTHSRKKCDCKIGQMCIYCGKGEAKIKIDKQPYAQLMGQKRAMCHFKHGASQTCHACGVCVCVCVCVCECAFVVGFVSVSV